MPRVKTDAERGPVGAWLRRERFRHQPVWTPEDVVALLAAKGTVIRVDYYRALESGPKRPGPELLRAFVEIHGSEPDLSLPEPEPSADMAALVAAIDRLVDELRMARQDPAELAAAVAQTVLATLRQAGVLAER